MIFNSDNIGEKMPDRDGSGPRARSPRTKGKGEGDC